MGEDANDQTIELNLNLNLDGLKVEETASDENLPEIYCCYGNDPTELTLTCKSMCECLAFHSVKIFKPNNTEMVACNKPSFDVPTCLKRQCVGRKGKGRSLADIGKLIGVADQLLQPGTLDKISKI